MNNNNNNEKLAADFIKAVELIAARPDNLSNLQSYLDYHFPEWLKKYANTPESLTSELLNFATMEL